MNAAIILSGGTGERMRKTANVPKQYIEICGRPILEYSLRVFVKCTLVDKILIVADELWHRFIKEVVDKTGDSKFIGFAQPGTTRQLSIYNGLKQVDRMCPQTERVIIHDAARPLVSCDLIKHCIEGLVYSPAVMPVLPVKDTCYQSIEGEYVTTLLPRDQLFAGQAPEAFLFQPYLNAHKTLNEAELSEIRGSSELAYKSGMKVKMIPGEERNFKVTTPEDLLLLKRYLESGEIF